MDPENKYNLIEGNVAYTLISLCIGGKPHFIDCHSSISYVIPHVT